MSFMFLPDYIKHSVSGAPGTGNATLGAAVPGFQSLGNSSSPPASGSVVPYIANDTGNVWEFGYGTLTLSGSTWTLVRTQVLEGSSGTGTAVTLSSAAFISITILAADILNRSNKNVIRNPGIDIQQRGTSGSVAAGAAAYTADGWIIAATGAAVSWSVVYSVNIAGYALRIACASGLTDVKLMHRVESSIAARLLTPTMGAQPLCKQAIISNQTGAALTVNLSTGYASARDNFSTVTADLAASSMQSIASAGTGQVARVFVPNTALTNGYQTTLDFGAALNASSGYVDISMLDLRVSPGISAGLLAAPPAADIPPTELQLPFNQRYYQIVGGGGCSGTAEASTEVGFTGGFPLMRASPTMSLISGVTVKVRVAGGLDASATSPALANQGTTPDSFWTQITGFSGLSGGEYIGSRGVPDFLQLSAEL